MKKKNLSIFIADDDEDDRELFALAIAESGIDSELKAFKNGHELMEFLQLPNCPMPDMIFLDLNMPILDGLNTLRKLRSIENCKSLKVAIYSTSANPTDIQNTFQAGASLYIEKPHYFSMLCKVVHDVLGNTRTVNVIPNSKKDFVYIQTT